MSITVMEYVYFLKDKLNCYNGLLKTNNNINLKIVNYDEE